MPRTCIALFSGGLDSTLALALMARQGIRVVAFHGTHVFSPRTDSRQGREALAARARALGAAETVCRDTSAAIIGLTKAPQHGYGKNLNACLDCRLMTIGAGRAVMAEKGADFMVSGEVVGQRPMSQRRDAMATVDRQVREMGLEGLLLRPLSAKILEPTIPENQGWVDRQALWGFSGRSRKPQMALAQDLGIGDYPTPAGGCLLTDPGFAARLGDLMAHAPGWDANDARLLRVGRHYRLSAETRVVASRKEAENDEIEALARQGDALFITEEQPGAIILLRGRITDEARSVAAGLAVHFSRNRSAGQARVCGWSGAQASPARQALGGFARVDPDRLDRIA